jgi:hypothetical protein
MLRASAGVNSGTWYVEFTVQPPELPHAHFRLGWANECASKAGPVGLDQHSYAYRDTGAVAGTRVHQSIVSTYGEAYGVGDVIGCLLSFDTPGQELAEAEARDGGASAGPADGVRQARAKEAAGCGRGAVEALLHCTEPPQRPAGAAEGEEGAGAGAGEGSTPRSGGPPNGKSTVHQRLWGSSARFFKNGVDQGIAFVNLTRESRYYPAASAFGGGTVRICAGPVFAHPPPAAVWPPGSYRPLCEAEALQQEAVLGLPGVLPGMGGGVGTSSLGISAAELARLRATASAVGYNFNGTNMAFDGRSEGREGAARRRQS